MTNEVYNATATNAFVQINSVAKSALYALQTQDVLIKARKDIHSLVQSGQIQVRDNMHLLLGSINSQPNPQKDGSAVATSYHTFDTLNLFALKLK